MLVSGAGVAGTTLAYWLLRHGFEPTVVERAPVLREGGYKIDVRGAALEVVKRMGVMADVRRERTDVQGGSVVTATGKRVASMDGDTFGGREGEDAEILRGDLNRILYDLTKGGAPRPPDAVRSTPAARPAGPPRSGCRRRGASSVRPSSGAPCARTGPVGGRRPRR